MSEMTVEQVRALCAPLKDAEEQFGYSGGVPSHDFNRELCPPGAMPDFPDGAVGIRVDDDFWLVATLPYALADTPVQTIVAALWPDISEPEFLPDTVVKAAA